MSRSSNRKHLSPADKETLAQMYGTRCYMCGSEEEIEWHHIKPLWMGGEDTFENMMPVCYWCHKAITKRMPKTAKQVKPHKKIGRPRKTPKGYKDIVGRYIRCEIGTKECVKQLGMKKGTHISDCTWYKEYLQEHGIDSFRNNVDIRLSKKGMIPKGAPVGKIAYKNDGVAQIVYAPHDILPDKAPQMEFNFNTGSQATKANEYRGSRKPKPEPVVKQKTIYDIDTDWWKEFKESNFFKVVS